MLDSSFLFFRPGIGKQKQLVTASYPTSSNGLEKFLAHPGWLMCSWRRHFCRTAACSSRSHYDMFCLLTLSLSLPFRLFGSKVFLERKHTIALLLVVRSHFSRISSPNITQHRPPKLAITKKNLEDETPFCIRSPHGLKYRFQVTLVTLVYLMSGSPPWIQFEICFSGNVHTKPYISGLYYGIFPWKEPWK